MKLNYKLGELIRNIDVKNKDLHCNNLKGLSMTKEFRASTSNIVGTDLSKYKIVAYKQFACDFMSAIRVHKMPIAFNSEMEEILVSPAYAVFEVIDENIILPEYLMMWFRRSEFDRYADFRSDAAIRGGYGWNELCETEIKLPSLEEQRKKVQAYKTITDRIELKKKINDNLTAQCSVDYALMLNGYTIESEDLPDGWHQGSIGSYCDVKSGFAFKSDWWTTEGYKVIKIANIVNNTIDLDSCDCVIAEHALKANNFYVKSGDILIAMTGATTGKIGIVPLTDEPIVVNQRVGKFFLGENPIEKAPFLYSTLLYSRVIRHLQPDGTAGSAQDNLSADNIKDIAIVLPENSIIEDFNKRHIPHLKMMMNNWTEIRSLNKMSEVILQTLSSR